MASSPETMHATTEIEVGLIRSVTTKLVLVGVLIFSMFVVAVSALWWALSQSQGTVQKLSTESACRSEVAQTEAAALDDIVILILQQKERPIAPEEGAAAIKRLIEARDAREDIVANGCS